VFLLPPPASLLGFYESQHCQGGGKWPLTEEDARACTK
jgi:hypothetical protein